MTTVYNEAFIYSCIFKKGKLDMWKNLSYPLSTHQQHSRMSNTIQSKGSRQRRLIRSRTLSSTTNVLRLIAVAAASVNAERIPLISFLYPSHHKHHRYKSASRSSSHQYVWGEVLQNAVGTLDKRQVIQEDRAAKQRENNNIRNSHIQFVSPLLEDGYPPAVLEYEEQYIKPILLYLPGFDGTILAPFLQFPSLGEAFDVRAMKVDMDDRSSFEELKEAVIQYLTKECIDHDNDIPQSVYLMGESFGGILATEVSLELSSKEYYVDLRGLILVNPATSYLRSSLYKLGPRIANAEPILPVLSDVQYVISLMTKLVPLFFDEGRAIQQLLTILSSKGLPSVVNNPQREAYMGRVAFDLPKRLKFMPKDTLKWRLEEWLEWGCGIFEDRLEMLQSVRNSDENSPGDVDTYALLKVSQELRTVIVVGELDLTLPSMEEAQRLSSEVFRNAHVHVVPGAGHASTNGGSLNLIQLLCEVFPEISSYGGIENSGLQPMEELNGLEPRYDGASIGLNPLLYWSKDYYRKWRGV